MNENVMQQEVESQVENQVESQVEESAESQVEGQAEQQQEAAERQVPLSVIEKLREEMQDLKRQNFLLQQQLLQQTQSGSAPTEVEEDPFAGLDEDDVLTVADVKKLLNKLQATPQQPSAAPMQDARLMRLQQSEVQIRMLYPDYDSKVERLIPIIRQNPALQEAILNASNPALLAYQLAGTLGVEDTQQRVQPPQPGQVLQQPGTGARSGGSGAISPAERWMSMTPEEFEAEIAKVKRGG